MEGKGAVTLLSPPQGAGRLLSLGEAIVLGVVAAHQHLIGQDVDDGLFASVRYEVENFRRFDWLSPLLFAAIYGNGCLLQDQSLRADVARRLYQAASPSLIGLENRPCAKLVVQIDRYLAVPLRRVWTAVRPRVDRYRKGLSRLRNDGDSAPEAARFRFSGLLLEDAARLGEDGEEIENILADYLYLSEDDICFARLYVRASRVMAWPSRT